MNPKDLCQKLSPLAYTVTQEKGTERPFTSEFAETWHDGAYHCVVCDAVLFASQNQFNAGCGWPSFDAPVASEAVAEHRDTAHGMIRTEVVCHACGRIWGMCFPTDRRVRACAIASMALLCTLKQNNLKSAP